MKIEKYLKIFIQKYFSSLNKYISVNSIKINIISNEFKGFYSLVVFPILSILNSNENYKINSNDIGVFLKSNFSIIYDFKIVNGFLNILIKHNALLKKIMLMNINNNFLNKKKKKIVIEFSSPNTNKPLHLGHLRNIFLGDSIYRILKYSGYNVHKLNLINDRGIHISKSVLSYKKFGSSKIPSKLKLKGDHFVGKYYIIFENEYKNQLIKKNSKLNILILAKEILKKWESGDNRVINIWNKMNQWVYNGFKSTYKKIGVSFDYTYFESKIYLLGKTISKAALRKNIFIKKKDNSIWVDLKKYNLDKKLLLRSNDTSLYITQDIAASELRYKDYGFDESIYIVGSEQKYNFNILFLILKKIGRNYNLKHFSYEMVNLPDGKMKSREGNIIDADNLIKDMIFNSEVYTKKLSKNILFSKNELKDIYNKISIGAIKYFILKVSSNRKILFNPKDSINFQGDTGPFIQYVYARIFSILKKSNIFFLNNNLSINYNLKNLNFIEIKIIEYIYIFYRVLKESSEKYSPFIISKYVLDLSKYYNRLYNKLSILKSESVNTKRFRIYLSYKVSEIIKKSMKILGIDILEKM